MSGVRTRVERSNLASTCSLRQFHAVALHPRKANLAGVASGVIALTATVSRGFGCLAGTGWAVKSNGNTEHVGVLDVEQGLLVQIVGLAAQGAAHHLLAQ